MDYIPTIETLAFWADEPLLYNQGKLHNSL